MSLNFYSFSSFLGKFYGFVVYFNIVIFRFLNVIGFNVLFIVNLYFNSVKIMIVLFIIILEFGFKIIVMLILISFRVGFLGRSDVRFGFRRSRDRDKSDRGN